MVMFLCEIQQEENKEHAKQALAKNKEIEKQQERVGSIIYFIFKKNKYNISRCSMCSSVKE